MPKLPQLVFWKPSNPASEPYTTSEVIAEAAGVKRRSVTHLIQQHKADFQEFGKVRFEIAPLPGSKTGQKITVYHLNEQQATLLMTYLKNTEQVREFKKELVRQFYAMRDFIRERATPEWQETRSLGKEIRRMETDAIKALVAYAEAQGSQHAARYYQSISSLANRTAGIVERDKAHTVELAALLMVEKIIAKEIRTGIQAERSYKEIYAGIKEKLSPLCLVFGPQEATGAILSNNEGRHTPHTEKPTEGHAGKE